MHAVSTGQKCVAQLLASPELAQQQDEQEVGSCGCFGGNQMPDAAGQWLLELCSRLHLDYYLPSLPRTECQITLQERVARVGGSMARLVHCKAALLLQTDVRQSATRAGIWRAQQCLQVCRFVVAGGVGSSTRGLRVEAGFALRQECCLQLLAKWCALRGTLSHLGASHIRGCCRPDQLIPLLRLCAAPAMPVIYSLQPYRLMLCVVYLQEWERLRALGMTAALGEDESLDLQASLLLKSSHTAHMFGLGQP